MWKKGKGLKLSPFNNFPIPEVGELCSSPGLKEPEFKEFKMAGQMEMNKGQTLSTRPELEGLENPFPKWEWLEELNLPSQAGRTGPRQRRVFPPWSAPRPVQAAD